MSKQTEQNIISAAMRLVGKHFYAWHNELEGQALVDKRKLIAVEKACAAHDLAQNKENAKKKRAARKERV